ncbi:MAG: hypothetical protein WBO12_04330 [Xanthobacteraceae bacterium]
MMFSEDLIRRNTLAIEQHEANEKCLARKKNRRSVWNKTKNVQRHRKSVALGNTDNLPGKAVLLAS